MIEAFSASRTIGVALWPTTLATQTAAVTVMANQIGQSSRALSTTLVSGKRNDIDITLRQIARTFCKANQVDQLAV
jgi:hypothetical protein